MVCERTELMGDLYVGRYSMPYGYCKYVTIEPPKTDSFHVSVKISEKSLMLPHIATAANTNEAQYEGVKQIHTHPSVVPIIQYNTVLLH